MIDEIAKDNENDQSNQRVTLLCALHLLALTSLQSVGKGGEPQYGFAFRTPEGSDTLGIAGRRLPTDLPKNSVLPNHLDPKNRLGLSYMDRIEQKRRRRQKRPKKR